MIRRWFYAILLALLVSLAMAVYGLQRKLDADRRPHFVDRTRVFLPNGKLLKWMSMGYYGLVGDWLWLRSVLYYGRRAMDHDNPYYVYAQRRNAVKSEISAVDRANPLPRKKMHVSRILPPALSDFKSRGLVDDIYPLLDRVTTVDPHFIFPYIFGGVYVLMDTGDLDDAKSLLEKGFLENPDSWKISFYLGWIWWAYEGDPAKSREYMIRAVGKPGCPDYIYTLLGGVTREANQEAITRSYLRGILESTDNEEIRLRIESVLEKMESEPYPKTHSNSG